MVGYKVLERWDGFCLVLDGFRIKSNDCLAFKTFCQRPSLFQADNFRRADFDLPNGAVLVPLPQIIRSRAGFAYFKQKAGQCGIKIVDFGLVFGFWRIGNELWPEMNLWHKSLLLIL